MLCDKKHSHVQWRDFKMNVLVCDDDQQIVDSIIEELKKKSEETHVALRFYGCLIQPPKPYTRFLAKQSVAKQV